MEIAEVGNSENLYPGVEKDIQKVGKSAEPFKQTIKEKKKYRVCSTLSRSVEFTLYDRNKHFRFEPNECQIIDEDIINHPDFIQQKNLFVINEVIK